MGLLDAITRRQIQALAQAAVEQAVARMGVPQLGPGTIASVSASSVLDVSVRPDGSTTDVPAQNITGLPLAAADRVMVLAQPPHGMFIVGIIHAFGAAAIPVGSQLPWFGPVTSTPPLGYLFGAGQAVSRTTYARYFGVAGTQYGTGDGSTTFNVPDLRGRVVVYLDNLGGSDAGRLDIANTLGASGGHQKMQQHTHTQNAHDHDSDSQWPFVAGVEDYTLPTAGQVSGAAIQLSSNTTLPATATNQNAGTGNAENMQPYILANGIIKV